MVYAGERGVWRIFCVGEDISVSTVTRLRAGKSSHCVSTPVTGIKYFYSESIQTGPGVRPASYSMGTGEISHENTAAGS
jgi:hypothetical protein